MMLEHGEMIGLRRAFEILRGLAAASSGMAFSELRQLGLAAPTLSRLLRALVDIGAVVKDDSGRYRLGPVTHELALAVLDQLPRESRLRPCLESLARDTGESVAYYEAVAGQLMVKAKIEVPESFHYMSVGGINRQFAHGFRTVALAFLDGAEKRLLAEQVDDPAAESAELQATLASVREKRIYHEIAETAPGFQRLAAPVFHGRQGRLAGVIGITFAKGRYRRQQLTQLRSAVSNAALAATDLLKGVGVGKWRAAAG